ncbi:proliferating cell nuclear antigen (pcna) [Candidatus Woesearchaeota archaeon]|nr:proliferating cell nuclear antigen (pcna) [Candidatus Woesearchaeota archaeon]
MTLAEPKYLKESIAVISELVAETQFKITTDAIQIVAMDPANVAMVVFKLLSSTFVEYDVKQETIITINLNSLKQVLRRAKPADQLTLEQEENKLKIILKGTSTRTFHLPIIEAEEREQKVPDLKFAATVTTESSTLNDAVEDVDIIGESVTFAAEEGKLTISSAGDLSKAKVEIPADEETKIVVEGKQKSKYSIEYLKKMILGGKLADKAIVKFSNDYPLRLEYAVLNKMQLAFILAPRVDND